jgi:hypothetical protein
VRFSPDGTKLASTSWCDGVRIWALDIDDLLEIARRAVPRALTDEKCHSTFTWIVAPRRSRAPLLSRRSWVTKVRSAPESASPGRLFAHGAEIQDPEQVTGRQVVQHARDWIAGNITEPLALREEDALTGDPHGWKDAYILSVHYPIPEEEVEESRRRREQGGISLEDVFRRWQGEGSREFDDWYREELDGWATYTWTDFLRSAGRFLAAVKGVREFDLEDLWPGTRSRELVLTLARIFQEGGVPEDEAFDRVHDFLFSGTLGRVPKLRIQSLLWAGMAHQAARGGRQRPPGRGAMSDVGTIATALPYCDAMLIDKEMRGLLELGPVRERLGFETKVFSPQTLDAFVEYLASVEPEGPQNVTQLARSIYGEPEPYVTIFNDPDLRLDPSAR